MNPLTYWIESTTGKTYLKVPELLPFETRMYSVSKAAGYVPDNGVGTTSDTTVSAVADTFKINVTNNTNQTVYNQIAEVDSTSLNLTSPDDSLLILPMNNSEQSNVPYMDLFDGCVAYYDFMGDAQDVMGNHDGTVSGATLTADHMGIQGAAHSYDGTNDYISVSSPIIDTLEFAIETMIFIPSTSTSDLSSILLQNRGGWTSLGLECTINFAVGELWCEWCDGSYSNPGRCECVLQPADYDRWLHMVATRDSNGETKIFIDGVDSATSIANNTVTTNSVTTSYIGGRYTNNKGTVYGSPYKQAYSRFWSRHLSEPEISALFNLSKFCYPYPIMQKPRLIL